MHDVKPGDVWVVDGQAYHAQGGGKDDPVLLRPVLRVEDLPDDAKCVYRPAE